MLSALYVCDVAIHTCMTMCYSTILNQGKPDTLSICKQLIVDAVNSTF